MSDDRQHDEFDEDFESFENLEDEFDPAAEEEAMVSSDDADMIDDAEFEDISDDFDTDVFDDDMDEAPAPKRVNWFNIGVAGIAVVVAGGLIASRLLSGGDAPAQQAGSLGAPPSGFASTDLSGFGASDSAASAQQAVNAVDQDDTAVSGGLLSDPDQFANLANSQQALALPDTAPVIAADDPFAVLNTQQNVDNVPMPAPITTEMPSVSSVSAPVNEEAQPTVQANDVEMASVQTATAAPSSAFPETGVDLALKEQVNGLEGRLESLNDKIDQAISRMNEVPNAAAVSSVDDGRLAKIEKVLGRLEDRLDDLSLNQVAKAPAAVEKKTVKKSVSTPKAKKTPVKSKAKPQNAKWDKAYSPSKPSSSGGWMLKGAQPGQAIIGQSSGEIREIRVGETIPGLGQITGIATVNGRWVVQGTQGRLSQ